ncbi:MAG TPA: hemerythrin domain-containing protein [Polyangiaceae bacterium]|jgi:hemerythrin-like domain-containing protein|nr:hemerythrin domain-containing protein [Polyangiaceae bacterium]
MRRGIPDEIVERRRTFLRAAAAAAGIAVAGCATAHAAAGEPAAGGKEKGEGEAGEEAEVTPGEDLMQEHGLIERVLLIYDEGARRIESGESFDLAVITGAAGIVRRFVEDYHERQEEQSVFPRLQAAGREGELVATLIQQHERGRQVTEQIVRRAGQGASPELAQLLRSFARMYRPHAAREDTVLFPAFREVVGRSGYEELGEQFEDNEHKLLGEHGFEGTVAEVAKLEQSLGIADLAKFTA